MLRSLNILNSSLKVNGLVKTGDLQINSAFIQCVRWKKRKPYWLPMAKSKLFVIPERPKIDESEIRELKRLFNRYRTEMHGIRNYLYEEYAKTKSSNLATQEIKDEEEEHAHCIMENDKWNQQIALIREERLKKEKEIRREEVLKTIDSVEAERKQRLEEIEQMVREEKERAKYYITADNIDKAIEDALATTVDHNYAIDLDGNIYRGRRTKPSDVSPDDREKIQIPVSS